MPALITAPYLMELGLKIAVNVDFSKSEHLQTLLGVCKLRFDGLERSEQLRLKTTAFEDYGGTLPVRRDNQHAIAAFKVAVLGLKDPLIVRIVGAGEDKNIE